MWFQVYASDLVVYHATVLFFPPPTGPKMDYLCAQQFIQDMLTSGIPPEIRAQCYYHFTCATDTENIKKVFEDVRNKILQSQIAEFAGPL